MGRAAAECFAADDARVAVMARGRGALDETVVRLTELGSPDAVGLSVDAGDATSIINGFAELGERWGELNSLVCAVGPEVSQLPWDQVSDEQFVDAFVIGALSAVGAQPGFRLDRIHGRQGGVDQHYEEPVAGACGGGNPGQHGFARHLSRSSSACVPISAARAFRPTSDR
jgi:NAD(P)-dependent dehydrogenase (short-subunit alcohol dehydrogenase family)